MNLGPSKQLSIVATIAMLFTTTARPDEPKAEPSEPPVAIVLGSGQATATPWRQNSARTGGGNVHVTQTAPDTISILMTGAAAARPHALGDSSANWQFDLHQDFQIVVMAPTVKTAKLVAWGRIIGVLRSSTVCKAKGGTAETGPGCLSVNAGSTELLKMDLAPQSVAGGQDLSIHDRAGPVWATIEPGKYCLQQTFSMTASAAKCLFGSPISAEFAPDPALEGEWLSKREPFHGAVKKDFGFQVILKVAAADVSNGKDGKK